MMRSSVWTIGAAMLGLGLAVPAAADVQTGVDKYLAGDYAGAIAEWLPYAAQNEPNALFNLGQAYRLGRGVAPDLKVAVDYYERAAALGHLSAQANLGSIYYFAEPPLTNRARAIELWQTAAAKGEPRALYMLGVLHFNGDSVKRDWPRAYAYTQAAAKAGLPEAAESLSEMDRHVSADDKRQAGQIVVAALPDEPVAAAAGGARSVTVGYGTDRPAAPTATGTTNGIAVSYGTDQPMVLPAARAVASNTAAPLKQITLAGAAPAATATPAAAPASAAATEWRLQLGAYRSPDSAAQGWTQLQGRYASQLRGLTPSYPTAPDGSVVRLQVGPFAARSDATARCKALSRAGLACFVTRPAGD